MGRVIAFYVPDRFTPKLKRTSRLEANCVIEFPSPGRKQYSQPTWVFPEVDSDLAASDQ